MLQISRWKITLVMLVVLAAIIVDIPNFFSASSVAKWPSWIPHQQIVLGLDLQGGAYLLYQVDQADYVQKRLRTLVGDIRKAMLEDPRIGYTGLGIQGDAVQLRVRDIKQLDEAKKRCAIRSTPASSAAPPSTSSTSPSPTPDWCASPTTRTVWRSACAASSSSRSRSSTDASTSSAPPSRRSPARATTASWSRRPASAIRRA